MPACRLRRACLLNVLSQMARNQQGLFELVEAWAWRNQISEISPKTIALAEIEVVAAVDVDARADALSWSPNTRKAYVADWETAAPQGQTSAQEDGG